jgi:ABC-2 type transport system permease protein
MKAVLMAGSALRRLARDRLALFFLVLLPVVIIAIIGITFRNAASERLPVGVADEGAGPLGDDLRASLAASPALDARAYDDPDALRKAVRRGVVSAGVVLPAGYDQALRAGQAAEVKAARFAAAQSGVAFDTAVARARALATSQAPVRVAATTIGGSEDALPTGFNYTAPANLVLSRLGLLLHRGGDVAVEVGELDPAAGSDDLDEVQRPVVLVVGPALDDQDRRAWLQVEPLLLTWGGHPGGDDVVRVGLAEGVS